MLYKILSLLMILNVSVGYASYSSLICNKQEKEVASIVTSSDTYNSVRRDREGRSVSDVTTQLSQKIDNFKNESGEPQVKVVQQVMRYASAVKNASSQEQQQAQRTIKEVVEKELSPEPSSRQEYFASLYKQKVEQDFLLGITRLTHFDSDNSYCVVKISKNKKSCKVRFEAEQILIENHPTLFQQYNTWLYKAFCVQPETLFVKLLHVDHDYFQLEIGTSPYTMGKFKFKYTEGIESSRNFLNSYLGNRISEDVYAA